MTPVHSAPPPSALTPKGAATRRRIVDAAAALMYEQGVAATRTQHVQARAGVGASQLFHYFDGKDALTEAVVRSRRDDLIGNHVTLLDGVATLDGLGSYRDGVLEIFARRENGMGCPVGRIAAEVSASDEPSRSLLDEGFTAWEAAARRALSRLVARGELDADAPVDQLATGAVSAVQGGLILALVHRDPGPLGAALDTWLDAVRSYVGREAVR